MSVETSEFLSAAKRFIRAAGARVANADEPELTQLVALYADLDDAVVTAIRGMRARGCSWAYIARGLGVTRQAAQMRYGKAVEEAQAS